jgi:hypothetical protein
MHVFGATDTVNASFSRPDGGSSSFTLEPNRPAEFTGPGTLFLNSGVPPPYIKCMSYFFDEDGFTLPDMRAIAGPSGSYAISVEKSVDLQSWSSVLLGNATSAGSAFYRLRIQP